MPALRQPTFRRLYYNVAVTLALFVMALQKTIRHDHFLGPSTAL